MLTHSSLHGRGPFNRKRAAVGEPVPEHVQAALLTAADRLKAAGLLVTSAGDLLTEVGIEALPCRQLVVDLGQVERFRRSAAGLKEPAA